MLSRPFAGWTNFTIGEFTFPASYLTNVHVDFINALTVALRDDISTVVVLDGEGEGDCEIVFNTYHNTVSAIHFVPGSDIKTETVFWDMSILSIAKEFVIDIENYKHEWENWGYSDEKEYFNLEELKNIIKEKESVFV